MVTKQPRKQRKRRYTAPLHRARKYVSAHVARELRAKLKRRSLPLRKGDRVKVVRGRYAKHVGKITRVDLRGAKVFVEGALRKNAKGAEKLVAIEPSNVVILEADTSDKMRAIRGEKIG